MLEKKKKRKKNNGARGDTQAFQINVVIQGRSKKEKNGIEIGRIGFYTYVYIHLID